MSKEIILGLTSRDFAHAFDNSLKQIGVQLVGAVAAVVAFVVLTRLLGAGNPSRKKSEREALIGFSRLVGIGVGIASSVYAANRLSYTTFVAEKALKFLILNLAIGSTGFFFGKAGVALSLICSGGALGYFGKPALYGVGIAGALFPFMALLMNTQPSKR